MRSFFLGVLLAVIAITPVASIAETTNSSIEGLFSQTGYRLSRYRAPTPETIENASVLTTKQLQILKKENTKLVLLDVQPATWHQGFFIEKEPRKHVPNSIWLPNVGYGELEDQWERYFKEHLGELSGGNHDHPFVIYCSADCWMSWNAVKRAAEWGYTQLYWYRNGSDGWIEADLPTAIGKPEAKVQ